ncbi:hypothetical protein BpHYR1_034321 [Brachionus plicatilis]|uniref:Uncharacterized protein n=1 Tax=Brachionus plicatilis TaxID=10195 RepID=A0A3M7RV42_BRAPC|nr:hypothetical protein BpHYR1_034321 [Brachionus plicatilis]
MTSNATHYLILSSIRIFLNSIRILDNIELHVDCRIVTELKIATIDKALNEEFTRLINYFFVFQSRRIEPFRTNLLYCIYFEKKICNCDLPISYVNLKFLTAPI